MIDRRTFLNTFGATAVLTGVSALAQEAPPPLQGSPTRVPLNGEWEHRIGGTLYGPAAVPASRRPSGYYSLERTFILPRIDHGQRVFIHFEAVAYWGRVAINGKQLGEMPPYVPCEFEFTSAANQGRNHIQVEIADFTPLPDGSGKAEVALGLNYAGWEAYGGIIRDVWAEVRPPAFVENVRLAYTLSDDYSTCKGRPRVMISSTATSAALVEVILKQGLDEVARSSKKVHLKQGANDIELEFDLKHPVLWSPERPILYELTAWLKTGSSENSWACQTGFRDIRVDGRQFLLNGKRLVLNGVCRHDMWKDEGFTLSRRQQERDMRMIKAQGCNFVRLVHYPHDRRIIELADQLGLLVSEEPGFWQVDFKTASRAEVELGYRILETTIRRDWNSPSVMVWFLSNECTLTEAFLREGKQRCNRLDPIQRLVSAANDRSPKEVKSLFVAANMDFFDRHLYTYQMQDFADESELDGPSKPLTFSEWGGKEIAQTKLAMRHTVDTLIDMVESGQLSGHSFWSWQDIRQYSRVDNEMHNGILETGVVTEAREPRSAVSMELSRLFELRRHVDAAPSTAPERIPLRWAPWSNTSQFNALDLQPLMDSQQTSVWNAFKVRMAKSWDTVAKNHWKHSGEDLILWPGGAIVIGGVHFSVPVAGSHVRPLVLTPEFPELVIPVDRSCDRLHILGNVTIPGGFPITGNAGDVVATYTLEYSDGAKQEIPLRNGYEVARSNLIHSTTRIDPIAVRAQRALIFVKDVSREHYQLLLFSIPVEAHKLMRIRCKLNGEQPPLALFAITTENS